MPSRRRVAAEAGSPRYMVGVEVVIWGSAQVTVGESRGGSLMDP